jgi:sulfofructose kinase
VPVVADLDELYPGVEALLKNLDYFVASRDIPGRITGEGDLRKALPEVHKRYGFRLTAATLGEEGVLAWDGERFFYAAAYQVKVEDTIGAGDTFHAGFIYGLLQGWPLQRQLEFGCAAAALNCTGMGARGGIRTVGEIESLMATGKKHKSAAVGSDGVQVRPLSEGRRKLREGRTRRIAAVEEDLGGEG